MMTGSTQGCDAAQRHARRRCDRRVRSRQELRFRPARGDKCGFLNMLWQLRIGRDGAITARPIPARAAAAPRPEFHPLIVNDVHAEQHLTWSERDGAVALLPEGEARQLFSTFIGVCDALRAETNRSRSSTPRRTSATKSCGKWRMTTCLSTSCSEAWAANLRPSVSIVSRASPSRVRLLLGKSEAGAVGAQRAD